MSPKVKMKPDSEVSERTLKKRQKQRAAASCQSICVDLKGGSVKQPDGNANDHQAAKEDGGIANSHYDQEGKEEGGIAKSPDDQEGNEEGGIANSPDDQEGKEEGGIADDHVGQ